MDDEIGDLVALIVMVGILLLAVTSVVGLVVGAL